MPFDEVKRTPADERRARAQKYTSGVVTNQSEAARQRAATLRSQAEAMDRKGTRDSASEAARLRRLADSLDQ